MLVILSNIISTVTFAQDNTQPSDNHATSEQTDFYDNTIDDIYDDTDTTDDAIYDNSETFDESTQIDDSATHDHLRSELKQLLDQHLDLSHLSYEDKDFYLQVRNGAMTVYNENTLPTIILPMVVADLKDAISYVRLLQSNTPSNNDTTQSKTMNTSHTPSTIPTPSANPDVSTTRINPRHKNNRSTVASNKENNTNDSPSQTTNTDNNLNNSQQQSTHKDTNISTSQPQSSNEDNTMTTLPQTGSQHLMFITITGSVLIILSSLLCIAKIKSTT